MAEKLKGGGPAFPCVVAQKEVEKLVECGFDPAFNGGMSLRDWFAGQFLNGITASAVAMSPEGCAQEAYAYADAMLKVRE